jgi:hypothetical protein
VKRPKAKGKIKALGRGQPIGKRFFGTTPKKPESDDTPGRDTRQGRMMSGFPAGAPKAGRRKLSARGRKRLENRPI